MNGGYQMKLRLLLVFIVLTAFIAAVACSGSDGSSGSNGRDAVIAKNSDDCVICHYEYGADNAHFEGLALQNGNFFTYDNMYNGGNREDCKPCHETNKFDGSADLNGKGKPSVTCIRCHWDDRRSNSTHYDLADMTTYACMECHNDRHPTHQAGDVGPKYLKSAHYAPEGQVNHAEGNCALCHTSGGFSKYYKEKPTLWGYYSRINNNSYDFISSIFPEIVNVNKFRPLASPVGCSSCHDPHIAGKLSVSESGTGNSKRSSEFNTCTRCHDVFSVTNTNSVATIGFDNLLDNSTGTTINPRAAGYHTGDYRAVAGKDGLYFRPGRSIMDTHFAGSIANKVTVSAEGVYSKADNKTIVGYTITPSEPNACTACHDPHLASVFGEPNDGGFDNTSGTDWDLRVNKRYIDISNNFSKSRHGTRGGGDRSGSSGGCYMCHNNEGFVRRYLNGDDTNYTSIESNYTGYKKCNMCHDLTDVNDNTTTLKGTVRSLKMDNETAGNYVFWKKPTNENKTPANPDGVYFAMESRDNLSADYMTTPRGSNAICVPCHAGDRASNTDAYRARMVEKMTDTELEDIALTTGGPHDIVAGITYGTVFYDVPGYDYAWKDSPHEGATCIDCHGGKDHTFDTPITRRVAVNLAITELNVANPCGGSCHSAATSQVDKVEAARKGHKAAVDQIVLAFNTKYNTADITLASAANSLLMTSAATSATNWYATAGNDYNNARKLYGLLINVNMLGVTRGAYAHNQLLTRQILWDAMIFLDGTFSGDAAAFVGTGTSRPEARRD
jgi:hypothetical protein